MFNNFTPMVKSPKSASKHSKEARKKLASDLISSIEKVLTTTNKDFGKRARKTVKNSAEKIARDFFRWLKKSDKKKKAATPAKRKPSTLAKKTAPKASPAKRKRPARKVAPKAAVKTVKEESPVLVNTNGIETNQ